MTQIEQIKTEIENLQKCYTNEKQSLEKECYTSNVCATWLKLNAQTKIDICRQILSFINSMQAEPMSENLKEEIMKYFSKNHIKHPTDWPALKNTALHFANWQKEQMLKASVEGEVHKMDNIAYIKETSQNAIQEALKDFADRDKVKLIIIKED